MRIVLAPDSMKGCLSAREVADAMATALQEHSLVRVPLSDGGEGFVDSVAEGARHGLQVRSADGTPIEAPIGHRGSATFIEVASVVGLPRVRALRPLEHDTFGVGELLRGTRRPTYVGLGGSCTVDGGLGMMRALGARFWNASNEEIRRPGDLRELSHVSELPRLDGVSACLDTQVALAACARTFGPQKGASDADIAILEDGLQKLADVCDPECEHQGPGTGAAGGLGFALSLLGAELLPGFDFVAQTLGLREQLAGADLCISAEGTFDETSLSGKLVGELAALCASEGVPGAVLAGRVHTPAPPHLAAVMPVEGGIERAHEGLQQAVRRLVEDWG